MFQIVHTPQYEKQVWNFHGQRPVGWRGSSQSYLSTETTEANGQSVADKPLGPTPDVNTSCVNDVPGESCLDMHVA